ncbi:double-stranded RNA-binding protein 8-like [Wolffia australiana]
MGDDFSPKGVADCFVFKSRLQEYAQKTGALTPDYETVKEGPSHEPVFRSTVIINGVRYESLPGFFNRKAAEQSAAEVALIELEKSGKLAEFMPTHESGLCKNLLQEYSQKMNYAIPIYTCNTKNAETQTVTCTVEIGGIKYVGAAARTKKEAEIKAARTALLAINSPLWGQGKNRDYQYIVLPGKKKGMETDTAAVQKDPMKKLKPEKALAKKKWRRRKPQHQNVVSLRMDGSNLISTVNSELQMCTAVEIGSEIKGNLVKDGIDLPKDGGALTMPAVLLDSSDNH